MKHQAVHQYLFSHRPRQRAFFAPSLKLVAIIASFLCFTGTAPVLLAAQPPGGEKPETSAAANRPDTGSSKTSIASAGRQSAGDEDPGNVQGSSWISQQPAANYTLQLMAAVSSKPLFSFAQKQSLPGPLAIAGFKRDDKVMHLLLHGSYSSRAEAESAAAQLEQSTGERPWIRRFSSLPELFDSNTQPQQSVKVVSKEPISIMGASWLWSRNPVRYTNQLMGDRRVAALRAFVARHRPEEPVAIVRVLRHGKPWYLLLAGDYANEEEAAAAIRTLSKEMSGKGPWPRRFASLQDQMVSANH